MVTSENGVELRRLGVELHPKYFLLLPVSTSCLSLPLCPYFSLLSSLRLTSARHPKEALGSCSRGRWSAKFKALSLVVSGEAEEVSSAI